MSIDVFRVPTSGPGDVSGLLALIDSGALLPWSIVAVLGKAEGNGGVNDFTREDAVAALCAALAPRLGTEPRAVEAKIAFVMSGGTEGVLSPHLTVFARNAIAATSSSHPPDKRLSIGIAHTREFLPEEIGRDAQIAETMQAVRLAMTDGGIADPRDVHFVQIKCPLLTSERIAAAVARGRKTVTTSACASMGYSRGASAIGVARALGEAGEGVGEAQVLKDWDCYSSVASASSGIELMHNVVIVMGNSPISQSPFVIGHAVMRDAIDLAAVMEAIRSAGLVRGFRHTMLEDTDITATRHARAAVGGLIGGVAGTGLVYVSGGAEHQGPAGGGPIAVIARR